jgi:hypothetical protein
MPANLTKYCLSELTDYADFESLCHDLMVLEGYPRIEPLGAFKDKGRDAIHVDNSGVTTIFAYSVREDWRAKLAEDATKLKKYNHKCEKLVFITTSEFTAGERDEAIATIEKEYGCTLELFGLERLRLLLDTKHPQVKHQHPSIFPPDFILAQERQSLDNSKNHLFISYVLEDRIFAEWLAQKLIAEGYSVWCKGLNSIENNYPKDVSKAMKAEVFRFISIYSDSSLKNNEVNIQRNLALSIGEVKEIDFIIPLKLNDFDYSLIDATQKLSFISFQENWAIGLRQLLENLNSINSPKSLINGKEIAAQHFFEKDILTGQPEELYSNCFAIKKVPNVIYRFKVNYDFTDEESQNFLWAYKKVNDELVFSFQHPPKELLDKFRITEIGGDSWKDTSKLAWKDKSEDKWIYSNNLVTELIKKSVIAKCHQKGLVFCPETNLHYFPNGLLDRNRIAFSYPDGTRNRPISVVGKRKYYRPMNQSEEYIYHLAPTFFVKKNLFQEYSVILRIRIYLTDVSNVTLVNIKRNSRRKHLCKGWWNDDWFKRILLISQFLSDGSEIVIGDLPKEQVILSVFPTSFHASNGIDERKLDKKSYEREESLVQEDESDKEE